MIESSVQAALEELKGSVQLHHDYTKFLLEINHYPLDYLAVAVLNRSLSLISGFCTLIENENFVAAMALVRLQLDNCLRFSAIWLTENPQEFAMQIIGGTKVEKIKDRDGNLMRDSYLRDKMNKEYPWVTSVYNHTSGYIHLSNRHISSAMRPGAEDHTVEIKVGIKDQFVTADEYLEAIGAVTEITQILLGYVNHWGCTKRGAA